MSKLALLLSAAAVGVGVAACGSSNSNSSKAHTSSTPAASTSASAASSAPAGAQTLAISAPSGGALMFSTTALHAKAGMITINFTNDASFNHNFTLATASGKVLAATPQFSGGTKSVTVDLKAGTYTYYCNVPGHRQAGMQGTLTVS
jgi:plastocyanin